ncbi:MAG: amidase [Pirellulaceae bacterium]|jgi:Asp-tRNA(Asn)/Glu-tRNA(Gln) amidotransferase A subunit family amidase|nr:amidase [Pirellulaceae bacterium]MDP7015357.1 amidase [Pirellulaceae bacterium]
MQSFDSENSLTSGDEQIGSTERLESAGCRLTRRQIIGALAGAAAGGALFQRALAAQVEEQQRISAEMVAQAEWVAGIPLTEAERAATAGALDKLQRQLSALRSADVGYDVAPAVQFAPRPFAQLDAVEPDRVAHAIDQTAPPRPDNDEDIAFMPVWQLASLLRSRAISSVDLTKIYLERLRRHDEVLHCVVSFTDDLALEQAARADREIAAGEYRGPLHGVPWGAKDLIAHPGYKTTWGAGQFQDQVLDYKATIAERLDQAGAVLIAKLTLGAIAWGDKWFGGMTRNPWNVEQGSSGSSAGSASAAAAGLVGFAIGSETLGSIVSPCRRCGATGLRPTFGRVSRDGCMTLAWSMDKLGPIARSVEDCALVFDAIHGYDGKDKTVGTAPFQWPSKAKLSDLKVGYFKDGRDQDERRDLQALEQLGVTLVEIELPDSLPEWALTMILDVESATVFDEFTRRGENEGLNRWPPVWRKAQFVSAVEYLRANRVRTKLVAEMEELFQSVDCYVGGNDLVITNFTGHPTVVLPLEFRERDGRPIPSPITFTGQLFEEEKLLALTNAFQLATGTHLRRPEIPPA